MNTNTFLVCKIEILEGDTTGNKCFKMIVSKAF